MGGHRSKSKSKTPALSEGEEHAAQQLAREVHDWKVDTIKLKGQWVTEEDNLLEAPIEHLAKGSAGKFDGEIVLSCLLNRNKMPPGTIKKRGTGTGQSGTSSQAGSGHTP